MLPLLFSLITLPYAPNALEPVISQETIEYHHGKHLHCLCSSRFSCIYQNFFVPLRPISINPQKFQRL